MTRALVAVPLAGLGMVGLLLWGLGFRLEFWDARDFIALIHGGGLCAVGFVALWRRLGFPRTTRALPGAALCVAMLCAYAWVWVPPVQPLVAWWVRHVSMFRFPA
jgi:hypothetical protein